MKQNLVSAEKGALKDGKIEMTVEIVSCDSGNCILKLLPLLVDNHYHVFKTSHWPFHKRIYLKTTDVAETRPEGHS